MPANINSIVILNRYRRVKPFPILMGVWIRCPWIIIWFLFVQDQINNNCCTCVITKCKFAETTISLLIHCNVVSHIWRIRTKCLSPALSKPIESDLTPATVTIVVVFKNYQKIKLTSTVLNHCLEKKASTNQSYPLLSCISNIATNCWRTRT